MKEAKIFDKNELVYETKCNSPYELMDKLVASSKMRKIYGSDIWRLVLNKSKKSTSESIRYNLSVSK